MNDENKPQQFSFSLPQRDHRGVYLTLTVYDPVELEIEQMNEFKDARECLNKFTLNGKN